MDFDNLKYINNKRIELLTSKEYFIGKKVLRYWNLVKKGEIGYLYESFLHDCKGLRKPNGHHKIRDFQDGMENTGDSEIVVYSAIYGNYDDIKEPIYFDTNCRYIMFTDQNIPQGSVWEKGNEDFIPEDCNTPQLRNRYVKMFAHRLFDCEYSIYVDGNLQLVGPVSLLVQKDIKKCKTGIAMHLHVRENCIYEEAETAYFLRRITRKELTKVLAIYKKNTMPRHFGMFECNVIVRYHKNNNMKRIMRRWWECYRKGVKRDQLYFTYVLYKMGYKFDDVVNFGASVNLNPLFIRLEHVNK